MAHSLLFSFTLLVAVLWSAAAQAGFIQYTATAGWLFSQRPPRTLLAIEGRDENDQPIPGAREVTT